MYIYLFIHLFFLIGGNAAAGAASCLVGSGASVCGTDSVSTGSSVACAASGAVASLSSVSSGRVNPACAASGAVASVSSVSSASGDVVTAPRRKVCAGPSFTKIKENCRRGGMVG